MLYETVLMLHAFTLCAALLLFLCSEGALILARRGSRKLARAALLVSRVANLLASLGVLAGVALVYVGGWPLFTPWLLVSFVLIGLLMVIGRRFVQPWEERAQTTLGSNASPAEIGELVGERVAFFWRGVLIALFATIMGLMATKPDLSIFP